MPRPNPKFKDADLIRAMRRAGKRARAPRGLAQATLSRMGLGRPTASPLTRLAWGGALAGALLTLFFALKTEPKTEAPSHELAQAPVILIAPKPAQTGSSVAPKALAQSAPSVQAIEPHTSNPTPIQRQEAPRVVGAALPTPRAANATPQALPVSERPWGGGAQASSAPGAHAARGGEKTTPGPEFALVVKNNYFKPALGQELKIELSLPQAGVARLRVFDANGVEIQILDAAPGGAKAYTFTWNGKDSRGADAASGAYTLLIETPGRVDKRACVLVR